MSEAEPTTSHEDVAAAFESVESEPAPDTGAVVDPAPDAPAATEPVQTGLAGLPPSEAAPPEQAPPEAPKELNAPQSWGVAERELWTGLDPSVQAQIDKREREISEGLTHTGDSRAFQDEFNQTIAPYQQLIAAENASPMQAVGSLLNTAASLMSGTPQTKAETVAQIINQYGVDLQMLDSLLAGQMPENNPNTQFEQMLDQRMAPINTYMQQQQQNQQQQYNQQYQNNQNEIDTFLGANEFAKDVAAEMGDLMQMAAQRNQNMSLQEAYEKAIMLRPDIQQVIQQRQAAATAAQNNQQIQQKQGAAVSLGAGQQLTGGEQPPTSMRDQIMQAMENRS